MKYIQSLNDGNINVQIPHKIEETYLSQVKVEFLNGYRVGIVKRCFLNFSSVRQINSMSLSVLSGLQSFFKSLGIEVIHINLDKNVQSLFKAVGLDQVLEKKAQSELEKAISARIPVQPDELAEVKKELALQKDLFKRVTDELEEKLQKAENDIKKKNEHLRLLDKASSIGDLAAGVAHEFNNLIGAILGYAQLAQAKRTPETIDKALENIVTLSKRSETITSGLLNYSRKAPEQIKQVNMGKLVQDVLGFTQKQLENLKIVVHTDFQPIHTILADEGLLSQVILNLVINASHAMENGGDLYLRLYKKNGFIKLEIRDTGTGIAENNLKKIFQPFFTTKGALGGGNKSGTGLGLSVSKNIVEMHQGTIEVISKEGEGATFVISLPESNSKLQESKFIEKEDSAVKVSSKKKILIVDDEEMMRDLVRSALSDFGHDIKDAPNGIEGVKLFKTHQSDLVFLDVLMPQMNGMDAYMEIKKINPKAKIVFVTGQAGGYLEKVLGNLVKAENIYLLHKPFEIEELIRVTNITLAN